MHTKSLMKSGIALLAAGLSFVSLAWTVRPGLQQVRTVIQDVDTFMPGSNFSLDGVFDDVGELVITPGSCMGDVKESWTNPNNDTTYTWGDGVLFSYRGEVYLDGDTTYGFGQWMYDGGRIIINNTAVLGGVEALGAGWCLGTYKPPASGWYPIVIQSFNKTGEGGPGDGGAWADAGFGAAWNDLGHTTREYWLEAWYRFINNEHPNGEHNIQLRYSGDDDAVVIKSVEKTASGYRFTLAFAEPTATGVITVVADIEKKTIAKGGDADGWAKSASEEVEVAGDEVVIDVAWDDEVPPYFAFLGSGADAISPEFSSASGTYAEGQFFGRGMTLVEKTDEAGDITSVTVNFGRGDAALTNVLYVAYGALDGGDDISNWEHFEMVSAIGGDQDSVEYTMPEGWGSNLFSLRFFLRDGLYLREGERISCPLGSYFNLGYVPNDDTRVNLKTFIRVRHYDNTDRTTWTHGMALFACGDSLDYAFIPSTYETQWRLYYSGDWGWMTVGYGGQASIVTPYEMEFGVNYCLINGAWGGEIRDYEVPYQNLKPLEVFGTECTGDLYYFRIREQVRINGQRASDDDGSAVHYFVPVVDLDGKSCLYDKVTGEFRYPVGTGIAKTYGVVGNTVATGKIIDRSETISLTDPFIGEAPYITIDGDGDCVVNVELTAGIGDVRVTYGDNLSQVIAESETGPKSFSAKVMNLAAGTSYAFAAEAYVGGVTYCTVPGNGVFYTGTPSVSLGETANAKTLAAGSFIISREDAYGDLYVNYTVGGTGVNGADFVELTGVAVIPDGETSVEVVVTPLWGPNYADDYTITLEITGGNYVTGASNPSATMSVAAVGKHLAGRGYQKFFDMRFSGYSGSAYLDDFPVLVRISEKNILGFKYADVDGEDGYGLQFRDSTGRVLDYEIDTWNVKGESLVWVSVPRLADKNTAIRCFYDLVDEEAEIPAVNSSNVWLKAGYIGVWHVNGQSGNYENFIDSTGNGLTAWSPAGDQYFEGPLGQARSSSGYQLRVPDYDEFIPGGSKDMTTCTISGWFKGNGAGQTYSRIFSRVEYWMSEYGWSSEFTDAGKTLICRGPEYNNSYYLVLPYDVSENWVAITYTFNKQYMIGYVNGNPGSEDWVYFGGAGESDYGLFFGGRNVTEGEQPFNGWYDELRIRNAISDQPWVAAEYETVSPDFISYSPSIDATNGGPGLIFIIR